MKALILAAGLGTRLRPFTSERAKPSLPILGVPTLWYPAWHLRRAIAPEAFMANVSHAPQSVADACSDPELKAGTGIDIGISDESSGILGSSGALRKIAGWLGTSTLAVCNGDSISFPDWARMAKAHRESRALVTLHVRAFQSRGEAYTNVALDAHTGHADRARVTGFGAKTRDGIMFAGSYLIEPGAIARLPAGPSELRPALLEPLAREGGLTAYREDGPWLDTGDIASFGEAQFSLLRDFPAARELVEMKMREESADCWVPRDWPTPPFKMHAPTVLTGPLEGWAGGPASYGPRFVGLEPPPRGQTLAATRDAVALSTLLERLK